MRGSFGEERRKRLSGQSLQLPSWFWSSPAAIAIFFNSLNITMVLTVTGAPTSAARCRRGVAESREEAEWFENLYAPQQTSASFSILVGIMDYCASA